MANSKPTAQTGALTLVLLVKSYKSQMIALLVKNGIVVDNSASDEQVVKLMSNLLKVSKSYFQDLNDFITNPAVTNVIASGFDLTDKYLKMTGDGYMNFTSSTTKGFLDYEIPKSPFSGSTTTSTQAPAKPSFWQEIKANIPQYLSDGIKLFGTVSTNKANTEIAKSQSIIAQSGVSVDPITGKKEDTKDEDKGMSTTSIVLLSLLGVAVLGTVIYFVARPKK
jgi:hypothetical protein